MSDAYTFYFNDIFPDFSSFSQFVSNVPIYFEITDIFQDKVEPPTYPLQEISSVYDNMKKYCYNMLMRRYTHCNIRYSEVDAFKCEFANIWQNKYMQYCKEVALINKIYNLSDDDINVVNTTITNMANNPNDDVKDPLKPLNFISAQTYNQVKDNKVRRYFEALNNIPSLNVYKFFKADKPGEMGFDDLFMQIQPRQQYLYRR